MDILAWLWWTISSIASMLFSLTWFLISGWVSTLLQMLILVGVIYVVKYGWREAPIHVLRHARTSGRMFWNWIRAKDSGSHASNEKVREVIRIVHAKEVGDINLSTFMTLTMFAGLIWLATL